MLSIHVKQWTKFYQSFENFKNVVLHQGVFKPLSIDAYSRNEKVTLTEIKWERITNLLVT